MKVCFVNERLAFGSKATLNCHVEKLRELGVTHVLDLRNYRGKKLRRLKRLWLGFRDDARPRPRWFYCKALRFYQSAMRQPQSKVYVMCRAGRRRSANMVYFLLRASGVGPSQAEATVRRARPCVQIVRAYRQSGEEYLRREGAVSGALAGFCRKNEDSPRYLVGHYTHKIFSKNLSGTT